MQKPIDELPPLFEQVSFEDYLEYNILKYPTLYARPNLQYSRYSLLDQILNVNGNGMQSNSEAAKHYFEVLTLLKGRTEEGKREQSLRVKEICENVDELILGFTQEQLDDYQICLKNMIKYDMGVTPIERTYEIRPAFRFAPATYNRLKAENKLPAVVAYWHIQEKPSILLKIEEIFKDDPEKLAEMVEKFKSKPLAKEETYFKFSPYPNFSKDFSPTYNAGKVYAIMAHAPSWQRAMLEFYEACKGYFADPLQRSSYHYAYEPEIKLDSKRLEEFQTYVAKFATVEEASKALGSPYTGDAHLYLTNSWTKELTRIQEFIDLTLQTIRTRGELI